jgi:hypothetical protein
MLDKKKVCLLCLVSLLAVPTVQMPTVSAYNVMAPNSFDEADTRTREYKAVVRMVKEGKAPNYTYEDLKMRGRITRYELTTFIIDLLDNGKNLDEQDKKDLEKIKEEYERELDAHGWKPKRKRREPIATFDGDFRLRRQSDGDTDARARVGATVKVTDDTTVRAEKSVPQEK